MVWNGHRFRALCVAAAALGAAGCMEAFEVPGRDTPEGQVYVRRCSLCHALPDPTRMSFGQWVPVVERMARNIRSQNVPPISDEDLAMIFRYLKEHARDAG
jgi:cytochrome c2